MKKLLSLILAMLLGLCMLPAAGESVRDSVPFDAFQTSYAAAYTALFGDIPLSWITDTVDDEETWVALMDETLPLAMVTVQDGVIRDIAVLYDAPATDDELFSFIMMCSLTGVALQAEEAADPSASFQSAVNDVYDALDACLAAEMPTGTLWGAPCYFEFEPQDDGNCHFLLVLDITGEVLP